MVNPMLWKRVNFQVPRERSQLWPIEDLLMEPAEGLRFTTSLTIMMRMTHWRFRVEDFNGEH